MSDYQSKTYEFGELNQFPEPRFFLFLKVLTIQKKPQPYTKVKSIPTKPTKPTKPRPSFDNPAPSGPSSPTPPAPGLI